MDELIRPTRARWWQEWLVPHRVARLAIAIIGVPVALWWLQPWKLLTRTTADEPLPRGAQTTHCGEFTGHIHRTSGVARLLTLGDGAQILRLENLHTILGPRLRVWLSDAPVDDARFPWRKFGHCKHIDLGSLRANRGNADYAVPNGADTGALGSVVLWCERFGVSFGAAQLRPPTQ
ncbi:DM13 domain-containing protein [Mycobacterium sp. 852014-50255_SCH5639931]|uniref:DM13 domain-containing protein n=1 Tax=Mycobacterium sp. 852014-50255_SCH5639931 TaxID=1834112 RepID=UPI0009EEDB71|nr:DM13 domain-containing protein [Mycobacterium sp. 852014-50255_SCH5639931]